MDKKEGTDTTAITRRRFCEATAMAALATVPPPFAAAAGGAGSKQCIDAIDVDMDAIAAPILERYNREREPEDTWSYFAEYLEPGTFIVNATGVCLTKEAFDRRDEVVGDIAQEIEIAANKAAGIEPDDNDSWDCCKQCYWDGNEDEIESPDEVDMDDVPLWTKICTSQWMVCCHY